jgi:hypothetical protein
MGLDVYLLTKVEKAADDAHEAAFDAWWETAKDLEGDERDASRKAANIPPGAGCTEVPSERYPKHLFNRRYLRSSYNGGGFNRAVPDFLGEDKGLYWMFEPVRGESDEYEFEMTDGSVKALEEVKARALEVAEALRTCDPLRVESAGVMTGLAEHMWSELPTEEQVLAWYREEAAKHADRMKDDMFGEGYSSAKGTVFGFTEGLEVLALTTGRNFLGGQAIVVYRPKREVLESYVQSAEITAEFCDEAIELIRKDGSALLHWSS